MARVKMLTTARGPKISLDTGKVYNLDDKFAADLVKGGFAVGLGDPKQKSQQPKPKSEG